MNFKGAARSGDERKGRPESLGTETVAQDNLVW